MNKKNKERTWHWVEYVEREMNGRLQEESELETEELRPGKRDSPVCKGNK